LSKGLLVFPVPLIGLVFTYQSVYLTCLDKSQRILNNHQTAPLLIHMKIWVQNPKVTINLLSINDQPLVRILVIGIVLLENRSFYNV